MNWDNWDEVQALLAQQAAQSQPMMGIPGQSTAPAARGQYKFNVQDLLNYQDPQWQNSPAAGTLAPNDNAGRWFRIPGADGQSLVVQREYAPSTYEGEGMDRQYKQGALNGYTVFSDPGDFGGGWLTDGPEAAKMNGRGYDSYDANGNFTKSDKFSGLKDSGVMGPWGALAVLAMPFAAAAAGLGAGAAGAGAAGAAEGAAAAGGAGASGAAGAAAAASAGEGLSAMAGMDAAYGGFTVPSLGGTMTVGGTAGGLAGGALGSGAGGGGGGLSAVDLTGTGLPLDSAGSVIGSQAGGGTLTNAGIESIMNGSGYAPAGSLPGGAPGGGGGSGGSGAMGSGAGSLPSPVASNGLTDSLIPGISNGQLLGAGASLVGGALGSSAADKAAEQQLASVRESNALLEKMFNRQIELQEPFRQNGMAAGNRMMELLGIGGNASAPDYGTAAQSFGKTAPQWKDFTNEDFVKDPGYQFRMDEGAKALQRSAASKGGLYSGAAGKALERYGQDYASGEFGKASDRYQQGYTNRVNDFTGEYNRYNTDRAAKLNPLQSVYGSGQTSANTLTSAAGTYGQNAGQNIQAGGNAAAAGTVGTANAWQNALNSGYNSYQANELMKRLLPTGA